MEPDSNDAAPARSHAAAAPTLDIATVRAVWSKTYNTNGKPDWSHIFPLYHPDVVFRDSIQTINGKDEFMALCNRLTDRCQELKMDIHNVAREGQAIFLQWTMTMIFRKSPSTGLFGSTVLTLQEDGRIISQRDYYDLGGDIFDNVPYFKKSYRKFMKKVFG